MDSVSMEWTEADDKVNESHELSIVVGEGLEKKEEPLVTQL